jgi:hypothetical protein
MQILAGSFLLGSWITTFYLTGEYDISPSLLRERSEYNNIINSTSSCSIKGFFHTLQTQNNFEMVKLKHIYIPAKPSSLIEHPESSTETFDLIYDKPWTRAGPYIVGLVVGFALRK